MEKRTIKFRAWDREMQKMYPVQSLHLETGAAHLVDEKGMSFRSPKHDLELMQFTGLSDKNGVPVYEGDIYRFITDDRNHDTESKVVRNFVEDTYWLLSETKYNNRDVEVIGNIYENPELLTPQGSIR